MVSTRGVKIKFAEGEKVLCYEPDPSKTKVLYDSKVLNIQPKVDKNGKKVCEFLIHFQGWSSSWDRTVTEDLILKDTEENRQLQKELAERAQLIARNGNLYRKERKYVRRWRGRSGSEQNGNMSAQSDSDQSDTEDTSQLILLPLPETISKALQYDEHVITTQNKVLNLPAEPNIVTILELFLKDYALALMKQVSSKRHLAAKSNSSISSSASSFTVDSYCRSMNLCREVVDGVRIYTDFTLPQVLLYRQERGQHHIAVTVGLEREIRFDPDMKIKEEEEEEDEDNPMSSQCSKIPPLSSPPGPSLSEPIERRRSLRSHHSVTHHPEGRTSRKHSSDHLKSNSMHNGNGAGKSDVSRPLSQREHEVLDKILSWNLIPDRVKQEKPTPPSLVYGAIHLCRVLLKLPEFIQKSDLPDEKVSLIMDLLNNLLKYLDEHPVWFGEIQYRSNIYPPPPPTEQMSRPPD